MFFFQNNTVLLSISDSDGGSSRFDGTPHLSDQSILPDIQPDNGETGAMNDSNYSSFGPPMDLSIDNIGGDDPSLKNKNKLTFVTFICEFPMRVFYILFKNEEYRSKYHSYEMLEYSGGNDDNDDVYQRLPYHSSSSGEFGGTNTGGYMKMRKESNKEKEEKKMQRKKCIRVFKAVIFQPILPAFIFGLGFNLCKVGFPFYLRVILRQIGFLFKPSLYLLIGWTAASAGSNASANLHNSSSAQVMNMVDAYSIFCITLGLVVRYSLALVCAIFIYFVLSPPESGMSKGIMEVALFSPVSTMVIYLCSEFGFNERFICLSAWICTISVFISFGIQSTWLDFLYRESISS